MTRWLGALALLVVGALIGLVGAFVQAQRAVIDTPRGVVVLPWGTVLALVCLLCVIRGATWGLLTRWGGWAVLVGWLLMTIAMSAESGSGDIAVSGGNRQLAYLLVGVIAGSTAATLPARRLRPGNESPAVRV